MRELTFETWFEIKFGDHTLEMQQQMLAAWKGNYEEMYCKEMKQVDMLKKYADSLIDEDLLGLIIKVAIKYWQEEGLLDNVSWWVQNRHNKTYLRAHYKYESETNEYNPEHRTSVVIEDTWTRAITNNTPYVEVIGYITELQEWARALDTEAEQE